MSERPARERGGEARHRAVWEARGVAVKTLSVVFAALLVHACGPADGPPQCTPETAAPDVNLTLVDDAGGPVCGANVTLTSTAQSQTYQPSGRDTQCNLYSARIPPDAYALGVSAKGFAPFLEQVTFGFADAHCGTPAVYARTLTLKRPLPA